MERERVTILIDSETDGDSEFDRAFLERLGHEVVVCHGPEHDTLCPLLAGTGCEFVDNAHGIVFALDLDRPQHRSILQRYREVVADDVPIHVVVRTGQRERYAEILGAFQVWEHDPSVADLDGLAAEIEAADRFR